MSQLQPPTSISLDTQSTELPIAWDVVPAGSAQLTTSKNSPLVLFPGKSGKLLLRSRNNGEQAIQISLSVQGDFPADWLVTEAESPNVLWHRTLEPKAEISEVLDFEIPSNFFESQQALTNAEVLQLQYQSELRLYTVLPGETEQRLAGYQVVALYIRPDTSYMDFLPEIYQQSDFLNRFFFIFEQAFDPAVQVLDDFWAYLNPLTASKALIPFLAEWVAWPLNPNWPLKQQRWLLLHAIEIYQWRGTHHGLQLAISLITGLPNDDEHVRIQENYQADFVIGDITLEDEPMLGGGRAFHFSVWLKPDSIEAASQINETIVRAVIEQEKPAFCTYDLFIETPEAAPTT